jgi:tripartite ATP-independent transporter DctM subunit
MNAGKITEYVFGVCKGLVGRFPGGLAHVNVLASLVFSGMTGSAVADASGLGKMEIDAMRAEGYDDGFSCAITAASATIGPIFPPSIPAVIYAMLTGASVGALFMAGMMPGVILAVALCVYIAFVASKRHYPRSAPPHLMAYLRYVLKAIWALLTPVILLVGIYTGIMTPTEAGAIAGAYALLVAVLVYRILSWDGLKQVLIDTVKGTGSVSIMVGAASAISFIFAKEQIGVRLGNWITGFTDSKIVFLLMVNVIILVLGMFVDTSVIQLVMIPILWPVAQLYDVNIIHFGLIIIFNMMIGLSTPPFGMCLFITSGISGTPLKDVIKEIWGPIVVMLIVLLIITYIPESVLFLPKLFGMM